MPLEIADYDINKTSFIGANNKDNLYIVYYNYVKANLLSGYININNHKITLETVYNSSKLYFKPTKKPTKNPAKQPTNETSNQHINNFNEFVKCINKIKDSLYNDFVKKRLVDTNTTNVCTPYEIVLAVKTNKTNKYNNITGAITNNGTKYTIRLDELMCIINSDIICRLEVCPEYFYLKKCKKVYNNETFILGVVLKSLHIDDDQLHKLPKRIEILIKYGINKDKIHDIKLLNNMYNNTIRPQYKSKKTIIDNILNFDK
jgi:hypothetical protein